MNKPLRTRNPKPEPEPTSDCKAGDKLPRKLLQLMFGQSVDSAGHPPDRKNLDTIAKETLYQPVTITENGRKITVPAIEAVLRVLREKSLERDLHAIDMLMKLWPNAQAGIDAEKAHEEEARERAHEDQVASLLAMVKYIITDDTDDEEDEP